MYLVVFMSQRSSADETGYGAMADAMEALAAKQAGFVRIQSWRDDHGHGCTLSWWDSLEAIAAWKADARHQVAQQRGKALWYDSFELQVCKVERAYDFKASPSGLTAPHPKA